MTAVVDGGIVNGEGGAVDIVDISTCSDEEKRKLWKPAPTEEQVMQLLKDHYCEKDQKEKDDACKVVSQLDSYDDANYKVDIGGKIYLLKIHNGVESEDFLVEQKKAGGDNCFYKKGHMSSVIHLQNAMQELLSQHEIVTSKPVRPVESRSIEDGSPVLVASLPVTSGAHSPRQLAVRLLSWVPGTPLSSVQVYSLEVLADAGKFLGRIDKALDNLNSTGLAGNLDRVGSSTGSNTSNNNNKGEAILDESLMIPARRYHQWDGKNTADLREFVQHIDNTRRRDLVISVIDAFQRDVLDSGVADRFRKGVNHADFNDANVLLDGSLKVSGIIDFGDSVESWRVLDISTAMAYAMVSNYGKSNRSLSAAAGLLRGYNIVYRLSNNEKEHLRLLIACRLACSVTLGAYSYKQNPENQYLLLHAEPAWKALELIWPYDEERREQIGRALDFLFEQACLHSSSRAMVVSCNDLVVPDPDVADLLESVRVKLGEPADAPPQKKQAKGFE